jgi:DNA topoisomerase III
MKFYKWLVIAEKMSVANDLSKALGGFDRKGNYFESNDFVICWASGHLLELLEPEEIDPKYKSWLLQDLPILPEQFQYKPKAAHTEKLKEIASLAKKSEIAGFINACDAGREGELIFREVFEYCNQSKPVKRLWLQSMTEEAIQDQFKRLKPGKDFDNLGDAARCRAESDWLIGMITRRLKSRNTKGAWSVGRVQTPTLALVVKRELEYLSHRAEVYWTIEGRFSTPSHEYSGFWFDPHFIKPAVQTAPHTTGHTTLHSIDDLQKEKDDRIFNKKQLNQILATFEQHKNSAVAKDSRKDSKESPPQLFDLTLLQREANRKFGLPASRTLQSAQRLYEQHKLLTYPRTDSKYLPEDYEEVVLKTLKVFSKKSTYTSYCQYLLKNGLLNKPRVFSNAHISDHFAIIPTGQMPTDKLEGDDARIFDLVFKRFLAAFYPHALWVKVERITEVGPLTFRTRVQDLQDPGWREVYGLDTEEESKLPKLNEKKPESPTPVQALRLDPIENATTPPPRHSEAKLLSLMEHCGRTVADEELAEVLKDKGIGTPATRADIIENLISKDYMMRIGRNLKASVKGIRLVDVLNRIPADELSKVELTGELEADLRKVEKGQKKRSEFMKEVASFTTNLVEKAKSFQYDDLYKKDDPLGICPTCQTTPLKEGFWGYGCSARTCQFMIWKEKTTVI